MATQRHLANAIKNTTNAQNYARKTVIELVKCYVRPTCIKHLFNERSERRICRHARKRNF